MKRFKQQILIIIFCMAWQGCQPEKHCHCHASNYTEHFTPMPGFNTHFKWEEALICSKSCNKPVLVKFTAFGAGNFRDMDCMISESSSIKSLINSEFVLVELYVDDKTIMLDSAEWTTTKDCKILKRLGRYNSNLQAELANSNSLPCWVVVNSNGEPIGQTLGYELRSRKFKSFLRAGLEIFEKEKNQANKPNPPVTFNYFY